MPQKVEFFKRGYNCKELKKISEDFDKEVVVFKREMIKFAKNNEFLGLGEPVKDLGSQYQPSTFHTNPTIESFIEYCVNPIKDFCRFCNKLKNPYKFSDLENQCEKLIKYLNDNKDEINKEAPAFKADLDRKHAERTTKDLLWNTLRKQAPDSPDVASLKHDVAMIPFTLLHDTWRDFWVAHETNFYCAHIYASALKGIELTWPEDKKPHLFYTEYIYPFKGSPEKRFKYGVFGSANKAVASAAGSAYKVAFDAAVKSTLFPDFFRSEFLESWDRNGEAFEMARTLQATSPKYAERLKKTLNQQIDKLDADTQKLSAKAKTLIQKNQGEQGKKSGMFSKFKSLFKRKTK